MTRRFVSDKWRPSLGMIVFAVLAVVAALPFTAAVLLEFDENRFQGRYGAAPEILGVLAVAAVTLLVGLVFLRTTTRPIAELRRRMSAIGNGDRDAIAPMAQAGTVEIADLAEGVLTMAESLSSRSDYVSTLAAHVSHEFKSPLTSIRGAVELLKDSGATMSEAERARFLDNIEADADRLTALVRRLREFAMAETPSAGGVAALEAVIRAIPDATPDLRIERHLDPDLKIRMGRESALIVFSHLVDNAAQHGAAVVTITAANEDGTVRIVVADDGAGISPHNRDKLFDAFFTTRRDSGGTGMGLNVVQSMLRAHGGSIRLLDGEGGAAFEIRLPAG